MRASTFEPTPHEPWRHHRDKRCETWPDIQTTRHHWRRNPKSPGFFTKNYHRAPEPQKKYHRAPEPQKIQEFSLMSQNFREISKSRNDDRRSFSVKCGSRRPGFGRLLLLRVNQIWHRRFRLHFSSSFILSPLRSSFLLFVEISGKFRKDTVTKTPKIPGIFGETRRPKIPKIPGKFQVLGWPFPRNFPGFLQNDTWTKVEMATASSEQPGWPRQHARFYVTVILNN